MILIYSIQILYALFTRHPPSSNVGGTWRSKDPKKPAYLEIFPLLRVPDVFGGTCNLVIDSGGYFFCVRYFSLLFQFLNLQLNSLFSQLCLSSFLCTLHFTVTLVRRAPWRRPNSKMGFSRKSPCRGGDDMFF